MSEEGEIDELKDELKKAKYQIDDLEDEVKLLRHTVSDLEDMVSDFEDKALENKNRVELDHIKMLEKFMIDNGFMLGNGNTIVSLFWELEWQINQLKKRCDDGTRLGTWR